MSVLQGCLYGTSSRARGPSSHFDRSRTDSAEMPWGFPVFGADMGRPTRKRWVLRHHAQWVHDVSAPAGVPLQAEQLSSSNTCRNMATTEATDVASRSANMMDSSSEMNKYVLQFWQWVQAKSNCYDPETSCGDHKVIWKELQPAWGPVVRVAPGCTHAWLGRRKLC